MKIYKFKCKLCNKFEGTRMGLRKHLKETHIRNQLFNMKEGGNGSPVIIHKQEWYSKEAI